MRPHPTALRTTTISPTCVCPPPLHLTPPHHHLPPPLPFAEQLVRVRLPDGLDKYKAVRGLELFLDAVSVHQIGFTVRPARGGGGFIAEGGRA